MRLAHGVLIAALFTSTVAVAGEPDRPALRKEPWEWTDRERIAALTDDAQASARVRAHKERRPSVEEPPGAKKPYDVIDGRRHAHLYFRIELFDYLTRVAFVDDLRFRELYREMREETRVKLGLPDDFWLKLEAITAPYRTDRRREQEIALSNLPPAERRAQLDALAPLLCRARKSTLAEAERAFGPALDRFLYTAVAGPKHRSSYEKPDEKYLRELTGECP